MVFILITARSRPGAAQVQNILTEGILRMTCAVVRLSLACIDVWMHLLLCHVLQQHHLPTSALHSRRADLKSIIPGGGKVNKRLLIEIPGEAFHEAEYLALHKSPCYDLCASETSKNGFPYPAK